MSGVLTALQAAGVLFGGAGSSVTLGPFVFTGMEVPEKITIGGEHALTVHKLVGGQRVIDAMGRDDAAIEWSGYLLDGDAVSRALYLDALRVSGSQLILAFGAFSYTGVVRAFKADYERVNKIPYSITFEVVQDNSNQPSQGAPSLLQTINNDLTTAAGYASTLETNIATAQAFMSALGVTSKGTAAFTAALAGLNTANSVISGASSVADLALGALAGEALSSPGLLPSGTGPLGAVAFLNSAVTQTGAGAALLQAGAYVGRALTNLTNAST